MKHGQASIASKADAVLLLGPTGLSVQTQTVYQRLVPNLISRLALPSTACRLEFRELPALAAIDNFIAAQYRRIVVLSLVLQPDNHLHEAIFGSLDWLQARTPQVFVRYAVNLPLHPALINAIVERATDCVSSNTHHSLRKTAILLVGRGSQDPETNAEIARIARLLWEGRSYGWVETAYDRQTQPSIAEGLDRCCLLGAQQIVVVPYELESGPRQSYIAAQIAMFQAEHPTVPIRLAKTLIDHPGVVEAIAYQIGATAVGNLQYRPNHHHDQPQPPSLSILPPRYRNGAAVSAAPMSAAPLVYAEDGRVNWDQIWGQDDPNSPFCELALAGGPPHRGTLLEPITSEAVKADWASYGQVLAELTRGIQLTTGLRTHLSQSLGWLGVECHSEEMALWLLRAIVVENISVRREGHVIYLPAGPAFRLEVEIKNVITALAKTYHYWQEHRHG